MYKNGSKNQILRQKTQKMIKKIFFQSMQWLHNHRPTAIAVNQLRLQDLAATMGRPPGMLDGQSCLNWRMANGARQYCDNEDHQWRMCHRWPLAVRNLNFKKFFYLSNKKLNS